MGLKSKKEKQSTSPRSWPDLPPQLLKIVAKNSTLNNIGYGGYVTKSYRVPTRRCNPTGKLAFPQLVAYAIDTDRSRADTFKIPFRAGYFSWYGQRRHEPEPSHIGGCSQGLVSGIIGRGTIPSISKLYLRDPVFVWTVYFNIPPWDTIVPFKHVAVASSPTYPNTPILMVLTGINYPAFMFYQPSGGVYAWIKQDCTLIDPYSSNHQLIQFTHAIGFKGKFYALSLQGTLAVIEENNSQFQITDLSTTRVVPSVSLKHFKEYLIESNGEILLVFLIYRNSIHSVEDVEVYRLRFDRLSWVKMESIGDRTLFVGNNRCMLVNARKVGCRENCIYLTRQAIDEWWIYDMKKESISPGWNVTYSTIKFSSWDELEEA